MFDRLLEYCPDMKLPLARLEQEHRAELEVAAATYLVYYGTRTPSWR